MKNHANAARAHFIFAGCYVLPVIVLLAAGPLLGIEIGWQLPACAAALAAVHAMMGWGAAKAKNWARVLTLVLAFPALLAVPLGTLVAIQLISYCWLGWDGRRALPALAGFSAATK
ncbi:hypothetical protein [Pseudoduganella umbonata]|uniref:Uncharacterized protein n=1 Tax=Pseudoduganella umbonata TaxID=864828 RepID=A0A4P8HUG7_9BURK|nr:hypothetical protein [Pseudoduganella umbonata]MBB3220391.1 hypothetical protein [Pseudoduganella umbonata]QCP12075.1 hypothetical protein FCL38_17880 [Pseudoduganella umbonata]